MSGSERSPGASEGQAGDPAAAAPEARGINRRRFLAGSAVLAAGGLAAVAGRRLWPEPATPGNPSPAESPPSWPAVLAAAEETAGRRLRGSRWSSALAGVPQAWSSVYVCWLLRDCGIPMTTDPADLWARLRRADRLVDAPAPGALIFYSRGPVDQPYHVGLVTSVTRGVPQTQEGDHPMSAPPEERFVRRFARPWDARISYAMPVYG